MKENSNLLVEKSTSSLDKLSKGIRSALDKNIELKSLKQE
jgi:hypothetical protein